MMPNHYEHLGNPDRWVAEVLDTGATVVLDDGSRWQVAPDHGAVVSAWQGHPNVTVRRKHGISDVDHVIATDDAAVFVTWLDT